MSHSPEPGEAVDESVFDADGFEIADCAGVHLHRDYDSRKGHWATVPGSHRDIPEEEEYANARLLALAPKLLKALKKYVEWHGGCHEEGCPEDDTCDCRGKATNDLVTEAITEAEE